MDFGVTVAKVDDVGPAKHAENLGYSFILATDSRLTCSNPRAVLALAAQQTQTILLGMGLEIGAQILGPETANCIASIDRLAPGRTFLGVGTGNTAMRTIDQRPITVAQFREHIRGVLAFLNDGEVDRTLNDVTYPIRFQNLHYKHVDVENYISIHVGGFGPKA